MTYRTVKKRILKNLAAALLGSLLATPALAAELSAYGMFLAADMVVKAVMIGLALASVASWTVLIAKTMELLRTSRALASATQALMRCNTLGKYELPAEPVCAAFLEAARDEIDRSGTRGTAAGLTAKEGIKERIALRFGRIEAAEARAAAKGVSLLASIGALAPFVGLFGTVWGIMNSFIGIAKSQTTNLAVVAPGIAEALLATAIGLVAAIPAVLFYNHLTRKVGGYRALVGDAATAVMLLASRELDSAGSLRVAAE